MLVLRSALRVWGRAANQILPGKINQQTASPSTSLAIQKRPHAALLSEDVSVGKLFRNHSKRGKQLVTGLPVSPATLDLCKAQLGTQ